MLKIWETAGHNGEKRELIPSKTWHLSSLQKPSCRLSKSSIRAVGCRCWSCARRRDLLEHSLFTATCATTPSDSGSNGVWPSGHAAKVSSRWTGWCHFYSRWVVFSSLEGLTSQLNYTELSGFSKLCWWESEFSKECNSPNCRVLRGVWVTSWCPGFCLQTGEMRARYQVARRDWNNKNLCKGMCSSSGLQRLTFLSSGSIEVDDRLTI